MAPESVAQNGVSAERQLDEFLSRYTPEVRALAVAVLAKMRERIPSAVQIVYDNYNALVVGFGPSERASEAAMSIAIYPKWVRLFFLSGATLPDPKKLLEGRAAACAASFWRAPTISTNRPCAR